MLEIPLLILLNVITFDLPVSDVHHVLDERLNVLIVLSVVEFWNHHIYLLPNHLLFAE
jgi:hypothetical protein